ncbi:AIPR family protein [Hugenholtzia roseola]|uniref:AIPR family protein n=1 Tax=Hugenholtzia roseola TaxID=1002 RepID=UPI000420CBF5|nr:AIPR family protein [Hugenholtzia roseola]
MSINKHIIDQRITKLVEENPTWFGETSDRNKKLSKAFVLLSVASYLDIELSEAIGVLTEGGNDAGIDALYVEDVLSDEFSVVIFQGKYKFNLEDDSNFPSNSIQKVIDTIRTIFDPKKSVTKNKELTAKIAEINSLVSDAKIPIIKCIFTNNGLKWNNEGEMHIKNADFPENQVTFEHFNHDDIVKKITSYKPIKATLRLAGLSIAEDYNFKRVIIGKIGVMEIKALFDTYGDNLLQKNVRRYLGLNVKNSVNLAIKETLKSEKKENFYFYNNGITMICSKFSYSGLQRQDWAVIVEDLQIINGGQTCKTIQNTIEAYPNLDYTNVFVLVRLYELSTDAQDLITDVTLATNSQSPVDLRDLRANDLTQKALEIEVAGLGFAYKRVRDTLSIGDFISSSVAAEAVFAIWREKPHLTKFNKKNLFGKYYDQIFGNLNAAQLIIAVTIYRYCDLIRRKEHFLNQYPHLPYSHYFIAMLMGKLLLKENNIELKKLTHTNFKFILDYFNKNNEKIFYKSNLILTKSLNDYFNIDYTKIEARRLSAAFRRGELIEFLQQV